MGSRVESPRWPHLQELAVAFSSVRPDGGWYFERDASAPYEDDDDSHSDTSAFQEVSEGESGSEYDSGNPFFDQTEHPHDTYNEAQEARMTGMESTHSFRTLPNAELHRVLEAAGQAAIHMPLLRKFAAGADIQPCPRTDWDLQAFEFEYTARGVPNWKDQQPDDLHMQRLYWTVPKDWRMGEHLEILWRKLIGEDGVLRYEEW